MSRAEGAAPAEARSGSTPPPSRAQARAARGRSGSCTSPLGPGCASPSQNPTASSWAAISLQSGGSPEPALAARAESASSESPSNSGQGQAGAGSPLVCGRRQRARRDQAEARRRRRSPESSRAESITSRSQAGASAGARLRAASQAQPNATPWKRKMLRAAPNPRSSSRSRPARTSCMRGRIGRPPLLAPAAHARAMLRAKGCTMDETRSAYADHPGYRVGPVAADCARARLAGRDAARRQPAHAARRGDRAPRRDLLPRGGRAARAVRRERAPHASAPSRARPTTSAWRARSGPTRTWCGRYPAAVRRGRRARGLRRLLRGPRAHRGRRAEGLARRRPRRSFSTPSTCTRSAPAASSRTTSTARGRDVVDGSQILAQSIVAACKSVPGKSAEVRAHDLLARGAACTRRSSSRPRSLHAGRSFASVTVTARQDGRPCARGLLLLDRDTPDLIRHQAAMPRRARPRARPRPTTWASPAASCASSAAPTPATPTRPSARPSCFAWLRYREAPPEPYLNQALVAHFTGHLSIATAMRPHAGLGEAMAHRTLSTGVLALTMLVPRAGACRSVDVAPTRAPDLRPRRPAARLGRHAARSSSSAER